MPVIRGRAMAKYLRLRGKKSGKEGYFKITLFPYPYFFLLLFIKRLGTSCEDQTLRVLLVSPSWERRVCSLSGVCPGVSVGGSQWGQLAPVAELALSPQLGFIPCTSQRVTLLFLEATLDCLECIELQCVI